MSGEQDKSQTGEEQARAEPCTERMEQMMFICGPEMKKWMEQCASSMSNSGFSCCGDKAKTETAGKK